MLKLSTTLIAAVLVGGCASGPKAVVHEADQSFRNAMVSENTTTSYYKITGRTIPELRRQMLIMADLKPGPGTIASTRWHFAYRYTLRDVANNCTARVNVDLAFHVVLPQWVDSADAPLDVQKAWGGIVKEVETHEDTHRQIARRYGDLMQRKMSALQAPTCTLLVNDLSHMFNDYFRQAQLDQQAFDRRAAQERRPPPKPVRVDTIASFR